MPISFLLIAMQKKRNGRKEKKTRRIKLLELSETTFPNLPLAYGGSEALPLITRFIWSRFSLSTPVELRSYVVDIKFSTSSPAQRRRASAYTPAYAFFACVSFSFTRNKAYSEQRANAQSVQLWR